MEYFQVIRSPDYLEHHGIKGMHWGIWNDETRARRMGSKRRRAKKSYDYSNLSDEELQRKLNRKRNEDQLRQLEKKEEPKSTLQLTEEGAKRLRNTLGAIAGVTVSGAVVAKKYPEALDAIKKAYGETMAFTSLYKKGEGGLLWLLTNPKAKYLI